METVLLTALISSVVPALVKEAEKRFGGDEGDEKRQWVIDGVHAGIKAIENHVGNNTLKVVLDDTEPLIDAAIEFSLSKIGVN